MGRKGRIQVMAKARPETLLDEAAEVGYENRSPGGRVPEEAPSGQFRAFGAGSSDVARAEPFSAAVELVTPSASCVSHGTGVPGGGMRAACARFALARSTSLARLPSSARRRLPRAAAVDLDAGRRASIVRPSRGEGL
ncbi:uncharacterized protein VDAG_06580 [Verticillium dahliae VdLs.17]|uniref:Uncharacterized protein n=1 Tax=Verticillium dahliae (strain VdLs.17 / ATCC MYA-4575 / FGSC 10137) TaxID=498257 RepID=G2X7X2_VERDV|nr:uncharacterized protein VDAG_06580 [Verticillium dahliae VdLs.17]EGY15090.1 hypothetical protein VDAG_06580 [Verticillium dahliae VdLs.17]